MLSTFSIRVVSVLIIGILNSQFDNSKIHALSESGYNDCIVDSVFLHIL